MNTNLQAQIIEMVHSRADELNEICSRLVQVPSETIPGDTHAIANLSAEILKGIEGVEVSMHLSEEPVMNLVAKLKGRASGKNKRLIFNGHLDTFPIGDATEWSDNPFSGLIKDGKLYGRGSADMKGAIASYIIVLKVLSELRDEWSGEVVVTLAGDEETMGVKGTKFLLDTIEDASGDAMINGDVGSPMVLRFGQKGFIWIELEAVGKAGHGAHVHKGVNAIDKLTQAINAINERLPKLTVNAPQEVTDKIYEASAVSEVYSGKGETEVLQSVTVNFGLISGGISPNLIPSKASAQADIRIPVGISALIIEKEIEAICQSIGGLSYTVFRCYDANYSDPNHDLFEVVSKCCEHVLQKKPVLTMRVGASDSRHYRLSKNIPTINCGLTPYNLGGPDEYLDVEELRELCKIHALSAIDFLAK